MKKLSVIITFILCISMSSKAQVFPYNEDFEAMSSFSAPSGWITSVAGFQVYPTHGTSNSKGLIKQLTTFNFVDSTTSPLIGALSSNAQLKFDYRVCQTSLYPSSPITFVAGDKIEIMILNGGNVNTVLTIDQSNHITSGNFATKTVNLAAFAGQNINLRIKVTKSGSTFDCFFDFDNISINSATGIAENNELVSPVIFPSTISGNEALNVKGIDFGNYSISILNSNGSLVLRRNQLINSGFNRIELNQELKGGIYLLMLENVKKSYTLKFKVQ